MLIYLKEISNTYCLKPQCLFLPGWEKFVALKVYWYFVCMCVQYVFSLCSSWYSFLRKLWKSKSSCCGQVVNNHHACTQEALVSFSGPICSPLPSLVSACLVVSALCVWLQTCFTRIQLKDFLLPEIFWGFSCHFCGPHFTGQLIFRCSFMQQLSGNP